MVRANTRVWDGFIFSLLVIGVVVGGSWASAQGVVSGAPPWAKEGLRLYYYSAAATVPGQAFYRDEHGDWVDDKGNFYSQTGGTGGHGCSELDILAVDGSAVVVSIRAWAHTAGLGSPLYPVSVNGYIFGPDHNEWWTNPAALAAMPNNGIGEMQVGRGPYKVLRTGKVYENTVITRYKTDQSEIVRAFDAQTGLLIHQHSRTRTADGTQGLGRLDFLGSRVIELPWANDTPPQWFAGVRAVAYQGQRTILVPGVATAPEPMAVQFTFAQKGRQWALLNCESRARLPGGMMNDGQVAVVSGPSQVGGLWIHPDTLRKLQQGQTVDQDQTLGTRVDVSQVGNGMVILTETGALHAYSYGYDANTGVLSAQTTVNQAKHLRMDTRLTQMVPQ